MFPFVGQQQHQKAVTMDDIDLQHAILMQQIQATFPHFPLMVPPTASTLPPAQPSGPLLGNFLHASMQQHPQQPQLAQRPQLPPQNFLPNSFNALNFFNSNLRTPMTSVLPPGQAQKSVSMFSTNPNETHNKPWSEEEQHVFEKGLKLYGRGQWKQISRMMRSRTPLQVKNHARVFFKKLEKKGIVWSDRQHQFISRDEASKSALAGDSASRSKDAPSTTATASSSLTSHEGGARDSEDSSCEDQSQQQLPGDMPQDSGSGVVSVKSPPEQTPFLQLCLDPELDPIFGSLL